MYEILVRLDQSDSVLFIPDEHQQSNTKKLSIVIPAYNEEKTVVSILARVARVHLLNDIGKEITIVNDRSKDSTHQKITEYIQNNPEMNIRYFVHEVNKGKGAAIHSGIAFASRDYLIIQDADLEYDPREYNTLLKPVVEEHADVCLRHPIYRWQTSSHPFPLAFHR